MEGESEQIQHPIQPVNHVIMTAHFTEAVSCIYKRNPREPGRLPIPFCIAYIDRTHQMISVHDQLDILSLGQSGSPRILVVCEILLQPMIRIKASMYPA